MENIYLPVDNFNDYACYYVYDKNTIRAIQQTPQIGNNNYTDFYVNSHYLQKEGMFVINGQNDIPTCLDTSQLTNEIEYRYDYPQILGTVCLLFIITLIIPYLIFRRLFGRWLKV